MDLKVLEGGFGSLDPADIRFHDASITDTRLMGVLGMHLCWEVGEGAGARLWHQYYYYDIEELGLDTLVFYTDEDQHGADDVEKAQFGGLGARMVAITEREARYLAAYFVEQTKERKQPVPESVSAIGFLLKDAPVLSEDELQALNAKMCVPVKSDYAVANYYLMRCFGHDPEGAALLAADQAAAAGYHAIALPEHATFLRNRIVQQEGRLGFRDYYCESLVEAGNTHYIVSSQLEIADRKVLRAEKGSCFPITVTEASLLLNREEFVTVYEILGDETMRFAFDNLFDDYSLGMSLTSHETGDMFMQFKPTNEHVEKHLYMLSDDVRAMYYLTDFGQLILAAYDVQSALEEEERLAASKMASCLAVSDRFRFHDDVLLDFVSSDSEDFRAFVETYYPEV